MGHEDSARTIHKSGLNCSNSVYRAFADIDDKGGTPPAPRSIQGKCGALLTAQRVLEDLGIDASEALERDFEREIGFVKCLDIKRHRISCNDCVGVAARLTDSYVEAAR